MWAAGLGAGLATVASRRVVGRGYVWLASGTTVLFGLPAAWLAPSGAAWSYAACVAAALAGAAASHVRAVTALGAGTAGLFGAAAVADGMPADLVISGALFLGAVTTVMMLGHWYLVDPTLSRPLLKALAALGALGAVVDAVLSGLRSMPWAGDRTVLGAAFVVLAATSAVLMVLVRSALGERGYSGVMAATGLSYLAMLTSIGAVVLGRMV